LILNRREKARRVKEGQSRRRKSRTKAGCPWSWSRGTPTDDCCCIRYSDTYSISSSYKPWLSHEGARLKDLKTHGCIANVPYSTQGISAGVASLSAHTCTMVSSVYEQDEVHTPVPWSRALTRYIHLPITRAAIKDPLLQVFIMLRLGYVPSNRIPDDFKPKTPTKCEVLHA
jgi:hypothetical protein